MNGTAKQRGDRTTRRTRWCPRCGRRCSGETFALLHDLAYVTDGRRRARVYEHSPCRAIVIVFL
jgi:hypothetical protein